MSKSRREDEGVESQTARESQSPPQAGGLQRRKQPKDRVTGTKGKGPRTKQAAHPRGLGQSCRHPRLQPRNRWRWGMQVSQACGGGEGPWAHGSGAWRQGTGRGLRQAVPKRSN